jgi:mRNA-degrading endonuclease toxin of MazEF toxin-antitoxin module
MPEALQFGRIVWVEVADNRGERKERPAIILTPTEQITSTDSISVVAITSSLLEPLPDDYVRYRGILMAGLARD